MRNLFKRTAIVLGALSALGLATPALATAASASSALPGTRSVARDLLVNAPPASVCRYHKFKVGVWAQPGTPRDQRRYVVNVYNPNWRRVLHKTGYAPTSHWRFWHVGAWEQGNYHTYYRNWVNGHRYTTKFVTKSSRC
jgi:hypothetical protein